MSGWTHALPAAVLAVLLLGAAALPDPAAASEPAPLAEPGFAADRFPKPRRPVADIVAGMWNEEAHRDRSGEADTVFDAMGIAPGMGVADIGAGTGYHAWRLARRLGPEGRVFAQDITRRYLEELGRRLESVPAAEQATLAPVDLVLGDPHDPRLPPGSVDRVLMSHMYHEIEQPYGLLANLVPALRPGALVAVLEIDRETRRHGTPLDLLRCEFAAVGYREVGVTPLDEGDRYIALFAPPAAAPEPESIVACRG